MYVGVPKTIASDFSSASHWRRARCQKKRSHIPNLIDATPDCSRLPGGVSRSTVIHDCLITAILVSIPEAERSGPNGANGRRGILNKKTHLPFEEGALLPRITGAKAPFVFSDLSPTSIVHGGANRAHHAR